MNISDFRPKTRRPGRDADVEAETARTAHGEARSVLTNIFNRKRTSMPELRVCLSLLAKHEQAVERFIREKVDIAAANGQPPANEHGETESARYRKGLETLRGAKDGDRFADLIERDATDSEVRAAVANRDDSPLLRSVFLLTLADRSHVRSDLKEISGIEKPSDVYLNLTNATDYVLGLRALRLGKLALDA